MDGWRPYVPNHVNLGMMNCKEVKKLAANDKIGQFLDNAKEGVIYVSFGSVIKVIIFKKMEHYNYIAFKFVFTI